MIRRLMLGLALVALGPAVLAADDAGRAASAPPIPMVSKSTADHSKFKELQGPFKSGPEVTKACLTCHTEAASQIHATTHWKWEAINSQTGQKLGKKNVVNTFCIGAPSNYGFCATCHVGYGWKDNNFDFTDQTAVDCLVCHDTTGKYRKQPYTGGHPAYERIESPKGSGKFIEPPDLALIAKHVGEPAKSNCGNCHFYGGGGDGVKHGDLDSSLLKADKALDVHMDVKGLDFTCQTCHKTDSHQTAGSRYEPEAVHKGGMYVRGAAHNGNPASCESCHPARPHQGRFAAKLNDHARVLACQTCHIPEFARGGVPTKMAWDWSAAGKLGPDGKPLVVKNEHGHPTYVGIKGSFVLAENVVPQYTWFNGGIRYTTADQKIANPEGITVINPFEGSASDGRSKIWPVKLFNGVQPYDPVNRTLLIPHTAGHDDSSYWENLDWNKSLETGMKEAGLPYSGQHAFIKTQMLWPITHMVAPKEDALHCAQCHTRSEDGRLAAIDGVYMPGRDRSLWLDIAGWFAIAGAIVVGLAHGMVRIITRRRRRVAS